MNNKILLGSIIAVVILILVSFTGVVGYQTTKSSTIAKTSPLFTIRSSRAIDKESKDLTCDYLGRGEDNFLSFPKRDDKTVLFQRFINRISQMDDSTFKRFLNLIINQIQEKNEHEDINELITNIHQIRNNPETIVLDYSNKNSDFTWGGVFLSTVCWFPGCYILSVVLILLYVLLDIPLTCSLGDCSTLKI